MSTIRELARLVASYRWLTEERAKASGPKAKENAAVIDAQLDDVFLKVLRFPAEDPQISYLQIEFLVGLLAERGREDTSASVLQEALLGHVKRLADKVPDARSGMLDASRLQN